MCISHAFSPKKSLGTEAKRRFPKVLMMAMLLALGMVSSARAASPVGVYQDYRPAPTPVVPPAGKVLRLHQPAWELFVKGGLALPMGENSSYNQSGAGGGIELAYEASEELATALFIQAASLRYKVEGAGTPFTTLGAGLKVRINLGEIQDMRPYMGVGVGLFNSNRATLKFIGMDPVKNIALYQVEYKSGTDVGFVGSVGGNYRIHPRIDFVIEFNVISIGMAGGTSETAMSLGLQSGLGWRF